MADLSGYTALTETHGATSAADLIDRYIEIVEESLVGDSHLQERTGDEVMIISSNADSLLSTALRIMKATSGEPNFLQIHGGLHYGKVLKRGKNYYGSAINLTSRMAAKAGAGTFWCSPAFVGSLSDSSQIKLRSMGPHSFKNVGGSMEMYALNSNCQSAVYVDSICKMLILDTTRAVRHPKLEGIYFCSTGCLDIFLSNPDSHPEVHL